MLLIQRLDFLRSLSFHSACGLGTNSVSLSASTKVDLPIAKCSHKKAAFLIPMVRNAALIVDIVSLEVFRFNFKVSLGMAANGAKGRSLRANVDVAAV